jgi:pyrrolidone-carboxylate peptidase
MKSYESPRFSGISGLKPTAQPAPQRAHQSEVRRVLAAPRLQAKLTIGSPGDEYEREADRVAEQVTRRAAVDVSDVSSSPPPRVQRACSCGGTCSKCQERSEEEPTLRRSPDGPAPSEAPRSVQETLRSSGRPLERSLRERLEPRFGADFSGVRVHTDSPSARDVSALAYTVGRDVVFAPGQYAPGTAQGDRLIAHELTHVVQQGTAGGPAGRIQRRWAKPAASECDDIKDKWLERVVVEQETPQTVNLHWSDGTIESDKCSTGKGSCCVDPATPDGTTCTAERSRTSGTDCTPITQGTGYPIQHRDLDHKGIKHWSEFVPGRAIALHEYWPVDGTPLSHGCVRLEPDTARKIFCGAKQNQTMVQVRGFARPKCDHSTLIDEWRGDFETAGKKPDGEDKGNILETRRMLRESMGVDDKELQKTIKDLELPEPYTLLEPAEEKKLSGRVAAKIPRCKGTGPRPTVEEARGVEPPLSGGTPAPMKILKASGFDGLSVPFQAALSGAGNAAGAMKIVREHGSKLWEKAVKRAQGASADQDDRPLYWARLDMARALRQWQPAAFALTTAKRDDLLAEFERASRGMLDAGFDKKKKGKRVLVSGFDPFGLETSVDRGNPSGAAVLALDGQTISSGGGVDAEVQSVIFPVRFADFDAGAVESFFQPYLTGKTPVDMIVTISQGGSKDFEVEKFAGRRRSTEATDNLGVLSGGTPSSPLVPKGVGAGSEFLETSLPSKEMLGGSGKAKVVFDKTKTQLPGGEAVEGSGGGYLSNEIFYRTALLRSDSGSTVPYGHLHTPFLSPPGKSASAYATARDAMVSQVREILKAALPAI